MPTYNILFASATPFHPERGGIERVTDLLARELQKRGHRIHYLSCHSAEDYGTHQPPASVHYLPGRKLRAKENTAPYHQLLKEANIDIVINQMGLWQHSTLFTHAPRNAQGRPLCISVPHNIPLMLYSQLWQELLAPEERILRRLPRTLLRLLLFPLYRWNYKRRRKAELAAVINSSDCYCPLTDAYTEELRKLGLLQHTHCHVQSLPNPVSFPPLQTAPKKKKQLLYVGRLDALHKATDRLLPIWQQLSQTHPDWELIIIGDGPLRPRIEKRAAQLRLPRLRLEGYRNPAPYLRDASILCLTSNIEGLPMVLLEAMSFGCIPFAYDSFPALAELLQDKHPQLSATPFRQQEYIHKLSTLMASAPTRHQLSHWSLSQAKHYTLPSITDRWEKLFQQHLPQPQT